MIPFIKERKLKTENEKQIRFSELDEAIDNMEQGKTMPHEEAMNIIREKVKKLSV